MTYPEHIMKEAKEVVARWTKEGCLDLQIGRAIQIAKNRAYNQALEDAAEFLKEEAQGYSDYLAATCHPHRQNWFGILADEDIKKQEDYHYHCVKFRDAARAIQALKKVGEQ